MKVGDIQKHQINDKVVDYIVTQADIDKWNREREEEQKQLVQKTPKEEIAELKKLVAEMILRGGVNNG